MSNFNSLPDEATPQPTDKLFTGRGTSTGAERKPTISSVLDLVFAPNQIDSALGGFVFYGDSLVQGEDVSIVPATSAWTYLVANALATPWYINFGKGGRKSSDLISYYALEVQSVRPQFANQFPYLFLWVGTNDCLQGVSAATLQANVTTLCASAIADGYRVVCFTILNNGKQGSYSGFNDAVQSAFNTWIRANQVLLGYTALIDVALMFPTPSDATYFNIDQTHLNATAMAVLASGPGLNGIPSIATTLTPELPSGSHLVYKLNAPGNPLAFNFNTSSSLTGSLTFSADDLPIFSITPQQVTPYVPIGYWRMTAGLNTIQKAVASTLQTQFLEQSSATLFNYALSQSEWGDTYLNSGIKSNLPAGQPNPVLHLQYRGTDVIKIGAIDQVDFVNMWSFKSLSSNSQAVMGIYSVNLATGYVIKQYSSGEVRINSAGVLHFEVNGTNRMDLQTTGLVVDGNIAGQNLAVNGFSTSSTQNATVASCFNFRTTSGSGYMTNASLAATYNNDFCLYQSTSGQTYLNAKTGTSVLMSINSTPLFTLNGTDLTITSGQHLRLGNAFVASTPTATGTVTIKDSSGTVYKVLVTT